MKIKSLLAAVSMVALTAGTANALSIPVTPGAATDVPNPLSPPNIDIAAELQPGQAFGNITFSVQSDTGFIPAGNNLIVTIDAPDGIGFTGNVTGAILPNIYIDTADTPNDGSDDSISAFTAATITAQDDEQIVLLVSIPQTQTDVSALNFDIPIELVSCDDIGGNLSVTITTESGNPIEQNNVATVANPISGCESAFDTTFVTDIDTNGNNDTVIGLNLYEQLRDQVGFALVNSSVVGLFSAEIDTNVSVDVAGTALTPASVDEITFDIIFEDGEHIVDVTVDGVSGVQSADDNTFSFTLPFTADVVDAPIIVTVDGTEVLESQTITVDEIVHDFTDAGGPNLVGSEDGTDANGMLPGMADLDGLQREGQSFGYFDWNSGLAGSQTISVYRVTGLEPGATVPFTATLENSGANGTYRGSVTADDTGEAVLFSPTLASEGNPLVPALPDTLVRYDFQINFETGDAVDVDRLMSRGGIVTAFNDGSNGSVNAFNAAIPNFDSDNGGSNGVTE